MEKDRDPYNKTIHIVVNQTIVDRIEILREQDERSFSFIGRKAIEIGLE